MEAIHYNTYWHFYNIHGKQYCLGQRESFVALCLHFILVFIPILCASLKESLFHSLIHSLIESSFCSESSRHCLSQTIRAGELRMFTPYDVWHITYHVSCVKFKKKTRKLGQSGGSRRGRVCYQRGLPCIVK